MLSVSTELWFHVLSIAEVYYGIVHRGVEMAYVCSNYIEVFFEPSRPNPFHLSNAFHVLLFHTLKSLGCRIISDNDGGDSTQNSSEDVTFSPGKYRSFIQRLKSSFVLQKSPIPSMREEITRK